MVLSLRNRIPLKMLKASLRARCRKTFAKSVLKTLGIFPMSSSPHYEQGNMMMGSNPITFDDNAMIV